MEGQTSKHKLNEVQVKVDELHSVMQQNLNSAIQNMDNLQELENKTENLMNDTAEFNKKSNTLRCKMCLHNYRAGICIFIGIALLITLVVVVSIKK